VTIEIREEPIELGLAAHSTISIAYLVERVLELELASGGLGGIILVDRPVDVPWIKDYDEDVGEGPTRWAQRFDLANWGLLSAWIDQVRIGGAVIAFNTPQVNMLRGRQDLAVLWDIRVQSTFRGCGVGAALFAHVEDWARERRCDELNVETQNINVPACRFYARHGCELAKIDRLAYDDLPNEVELLWRKAVG
jgi:GNAT superfamily N-acetyltransferase